MKFTVQAPDRLDRAVAVALPNHSRSRLTELVDAGLVQVDGVAQKRSFRVFPGMEISLDEPEDRAAHDLTPADIDLEILFENADMLVVNKPRGLATHPAQSLKEPSLVNALLARAGSLSTAGGDFRPGIVHRLDKDTTGVILVAKNDRAHVDLAKQIELRTARREYLAVVAGDLRVDGDSLRIEAPIARDKHNRLKMALDADGKPAVTLVRVVKRIDAGTLVRCRLETGRTHQIRVHLSSIGHPVLGDSLYAPRSMQGVPLQLHALSIEFALPGSSERKTVEAAPPADFLGA
jgi:23S rRNA pseudouridine1911/1915/1917 synthase